MKIEKAAWNVKLPCLVFPWHIFIISVFTTTMAINIILVLEAQTKFIMTRQLSWKMDKIDWEKSHTAFDFNQNVQDIEVVVVVNATLCCDLSEV